MQKETWEQTIAQLKKSTSIDVIDEAVAITLLNEEIPAALARSLLDVPHSTEEKPTIGVLFSGGVDSTFLCFLLHLAKIPFVAVTIGFQDLKNPQIVTKGFLECQKFKNKGWGVQRQDRPKRIFSHNTEQKLPDDILVAREVAKKYGFTHIEKIYQFDDVATLFKETVQILGPELTNAVNVGVGSVELAGVQTLHESYPDIKHIMGGLGSEEIFAGYKRHADATNITEECWNGLEAMYTRDLLRDFAIAKAQGITWLTPLLDETLIVQAMRIHEDLKLKNGLSKWILRATTLALGLDKEFALRPKKAAQYGSRTDRAIEKLAKKNGFSFKKDYLASLL